MSELKPCPFCGDEVEIIATGLYHWKYAIRHKSKAECVLDADAFVLPYEKEEVVRMWNIRADRKTEPTHELRTETHECVKDTHDKIEPNNSEKPNNSTISKMEQVDKDINVRSKDEPQTNADQHVQHVESVEPTWTKEDHEAFYTFLWNVINPNEMQDYIGMFETKTEPQTERSE